MSEFDEVAALLEPILDCFSGTDGGVSYLKLRAMLEGLQIDAKGGSGSAIKLMGIVAQFSRLVKLNQKE
jgi:hypothetical protein